ncbi:MAG: type II toxin-antitoxin system Phd/YefM family antitoxin [Actinomycetota bacterium]
MTTQVNVHEAKTHLSKLIEQVANGEEVVIAKAGKPVARLIRIASSGKRVSGSAKGQISISDDFDDPLPDEELARWYGEPAPKKRPRKKS